MAQPARASKKAPYWSTHRVLTGLDIPSACLPKKKRAAREATLAEIVRWMSQGDQKDPAAARTQAAFDAEIEQREQEAERKAREFRERIEAAEAAADARARPEAEADDPTRLIQPSDRIRELTRIATLDGLVSLSPEPSEYRSAASILAKRFNGMGEDEFAWEINRDTRWSASARAAFVEHKIEVEYKSLAQIRDLAKKHGLACPFSEHPKNGRAGCFHFWRRAIRAMTRQARGMLDIECRAVAPYKYSSARALAERRAQLDENRHLLGQQYITDDEGNAINLGEMAERGRVGRAAEMAHRAWALNALAEEEGLWPYLLTITCPSQMHPNSDKYDGISPAEAGRYLCRQYKKLQDSLARRYSKILNTGIPGYFIRAAEGHGDECPHFHVAIWIKKEDAGQVLNAAKKYFLNNADPDEPGARERRITFIKIKPRGVNNPTIKEAGLAMVSYICKYILKNTGRDDFTDKNGGVYNCAAVDAWRARWGIRAFSFGAFHTRIGQITVWREARRKGVLAEAGGYIHRLQQGALAPNYAEFCRVANTIRADGFRLGILRGEERENRYGEPTLGPVLGIKVSILPT